MPTVIYLQGRQYTTNESAATVITRLLAAQGKYCSMTLNAGVFTIDAVYDPTRSYFFNPLQVQEIRVVP